MSGKFTVYHRQKSDHCVESFAIHFVDPNIKVVITDNDIIIIDGFRRVFEWPNNNSIQGTFDRLRSLFEKMMDPDLSKVKEAIIMP